MRSPSAEFKQKPLTRRAPNPRATASQIGCADGLAVALQARHFLGHDLDTTSRNVWAWARLEKHSTCSPSHPDAPGLGGL